MGFTINNLHYSYPRSTKNLFSGLSLSVSQREFSCLLGPNGSGKSTLLKIISGILPVPNGSEIKILGKNISHYNRRELAKIVVYIPQKINEVLPISAYDFVLQGRFPHSNGFSSYTTLDHEVVKENFVSLNLNDLQEKRISELSTGELQLLCIARACVTDPEIFLLDESFSNLDYVYKTRILKILNKLNLKGKTILISSHDYDLVSEYCKSVFWIKNGALIAFGETQSLMNKEILKEVFPDSLEYSFGQNPYTGKKNLFYSPNLHVNIDR